MFTVKITPFLPSIIQLITYKYTFTECKMRHNDKSLLTSCEQRSCNKDPIPSQIKSANSCYKPNSSPEFYPLSHKRCHLEQLSISLICWSLFNFFPCNLSTFTTFYNLQICDCFYPSYAYLFHKPNLKGKTKPESIPNHQNSSSALYIVSIHFDAPLLSPSKLWKFMFQMQA